MNIKELPTIERPCEKFSFYGAKKLSDSELLAIIIKTGTKDKTAVMLAQELMNKYDYDSRGLAFLNDVSLAELQKIKGIGRIKAIQLKAVWELIKRSSKPIALKKHKILSPSNAAEFLMEDLRYLKQEIVVVILLDVKNEIIKTVTVAIGGLSQSGVEAREIFKEPIKNSASSIILAHNHPSGDPSPSDSDIVFTKRIYDAGKIFGIEVLDHIIIGNGIFSSLKKMGKF